MTTKIADFLADFLMKNFTGW